MSEPRAFKVTVCEGDDGAIIVAHTPAQAKAATMRAAHEAGFKMVWTGLRCLRSSEFDVLVPVIDMYRAYDPDYLQSYYLADRQAVAP